MAKIVQNKSYAWCENMHLFIFLKFKH